MKTFLYNCRDQNWAIKRGTIQANDRAEALRELQARGYVPLTLEEGAVFQKSAGLLTKQPRASKWIAYSLLVLIVGITGFILLRPGKSVVKTPSVTKPAVVKKAGTDKSGTANKPHPVTAHPQQTPPHIESTTVLVTPQQRNVSRPQPISQRDEEQRKRIEEELQRPNRPATEQLITMLGLPGEESPPLPLSQDETLEQDFAASLSNVITVLDTDDDRSVAVKENVAWIKQFIKQGQEMGWTPGDYLRELQIKRKEESAIRQHASQIMTEVEKAAAPHEQEIVAGAREQLNKELTDQGIVPLDDDSEK